MSVNILANVADKQPLEFSYGDRGLPLTLLSDQAVSIPGVGTEFAERAVRFNDRERVEIYDFNAKYEGEYFDLEAFYHTPRFHWVNSSGCLSATLARILTDI